MAASEITLLLDEYQAMLASLPQRRRRLPFRLRYPGVGTEHFLVEHIRTVLDVVERRCRVLMAIREHDRECVSDDAQRVESFAASLPMPVSRWYVLALAALIVVVAQLLLAPASRQLADQGKGTELAQQLEKLATRQFTAPADAVQAVLHTSVYGVCTVGFCLCLAAYLVLAPLAAGLQASRAILDPPDLPTLTVWRRIRPIRVRSVERTSVAAIERRVFDKLGLSLPRESQLGLFVKAMPCVAAILLAFVVLSLYSAGVNRGRMPANSGGIVTTSAGVLVQSSASVNFDQPVGELIVD